MRNGVAGLRDKQLATEGANAMADSNNSAGGKPKILGVAHDMTDEEADGIAQMIQEAQHSARQQTIPREDLAESATTTMSPEVERVVAESHVRDILRKFNRDFLYNQGRFDEYAGGLLLKWGDGYSRKHIWITVEGDNLIFETSHERPCGKAVCAKGHHIYPPALWHDSRVINDELAEQFRRPVYERTDD
jgi:hypothetical protein